jgi:hypothetical protein
LLKHALSATAARPSAKWLKTGEKLIGAIGRDTVLAALNRWLPHVAQGRSITRLGAFPGDTRSAADVMHEENARAPGLVWLTPTLARGRTDGVLVSSARCRRCRPLGVSQGVSIGPRAIKAGNAAVYTAWS